VPPAPAVGALRSTEGFACGAFAAFISGRTAQHLRGLSSSRKRFSKLFGNPVRA